MLLVKNTGYLLIEIADCRPCAVQFLSLLLSAATVLLSIVADDLRDTAARRIKLLLF